MKKLVLCLCLAAPVFAVDEYIKELKVNLDGVSPKYKVLIKEFVGCGIEDGMSRKDILRTVNDLIGDDKYMQEAREIALDPRLKSKKVEDKLNWFKSQYIAGDVTSKTTKTSRCEIQNGRPVLIEETQTEPFVLPPNCFKTPAGKAPPPNITIVLNKTTKKTWQ